MLYNTWLKFLLWVFRKSFRHKDSTLAYQLHNLANEYDPHPQNKSDWS